MLCYASSPVYIIQYLFQHSCYRSLSHDKCPNIAYFSHQCCCVPKEKHLYYCKFDWENSPRRKSKVLVHHVCLCIRMISSLASFCFEFYVVSMHWDIHNEMVDCFVYSFHTRSDCYSQLHWTTDLLCISKTTTRQAIVVECAKRLSFTQLTVVFFVSLYFEIANWFSAQCIRNNPFGTAATIWPCIFLWKIMSRLWRSVPREIRFFSGWLPSKVTAHSLLLLILLIFFYFLIL